MNKNFLYLLTGVAIGIIIEKILNKRRTNVIVTEDDTSPSDDDLLSVDDIIAYYKGNSESPADMDDSKIVRPPELISAEKYKEAIEKEEYKATELIYYETSALLADKDENVFSYDDSVGMVGKIILDHMSDLFEDEDTLYVKNHERKTVYAIDDWI